MRIGHYAIRLRDQGGIAEYITRVATAQREAGHEIHLFHSRPAAPPATLVHSDEELFEVARGLDILHLHDSVNVVPPRGLAVVRTLHGHQAYCPSGSQFLRTLRKPCQRVAGPMCAWGYTVERCGSVRPGALSASLQNIDEERATLPHIQVVAVSCFARRQMVRAGFDESKLHVIHHPAPRSHGPSRNEGPRFLFAGRLAPEKGLDWLLRALARVPDVDLDVAGAGRLEPELRRLATRLGIRDRVAFHGWLEQEALGALLARTRALVFPSLWQEPAGLVTLDAAAYGRAVVASRVGGIPEYAHHRQSALLVEPDDVEGLADAITTLAEDAALADSLGAAGLELALTRFSMETHLKALHQVYELARAGRSGEVVRAASGSR